MTSCYNKFDDNFSWCTPLPQKWRALHKCYQMNKHHLAPNKLVDSTTGQPGVVANEIFAEEEALVNDTPTYLAVDDETEPQGSALEIAQKENDGYAVPMSELRIIMIATYLTAFLSALDMTIVSTLLTPIASDLNAIPNMSWIATAYLLSSAAFQPIYGKLSDIFGRKLVLLVCDALFAVGCVICSFRSFPMVVLGRFIAGMGGSGFNTVSTVSISDLVPLRDRGVYQGLANIAFLMGAAAGGVLGGIINHYFGWQWIFILQVPVCGWIGFAYWRFFYLPEGSPGLGYNGHIRDKLAKVDFLGAATLVTLLITILLAASLGNQYFSYTSPTFFGLIVLAAILLVVFILIELKYSPEPILPIHLMGNRTILSSSLVNWFIVMGSFTYIFYYPVYLAAVIQLPSNEVGYRIVSNFVGVSLGSLGAGYYMRHTGKYYKLGIFALVCSLVGVSSFIFLTPTTPTIVQLLIMFLPGVGYAIMLTVTLLALISAAPVKHQAGVTSIQYTFRSTGSTLGVAIASAIFQHGLSRALNTRIPQVVADPKAARKIIGHALKNADFGKTQTEAINKVIVGCYEAGTRGTFYFGFVVVCLGMVSGVFMRENVLHKSVTRD